MMMTAAVVAFLCPFANLKPQKESKSASSIVPPHGNDLIACVPKMYLSPQIWIWHWDTKCDWIRVSRWQLFFFCVCFVAAVEGKIEDFEYSNRSDRCRYKLLLLNEHWTCPGCCQKHFHRFAAFDLIWKFLAVYFFRSRSEWRSLNS